MVRLWRSLQRSARLSDPLRPLHARSRMTMLRRLLAPFAALLAFASPAAARAPAPARPALWEVSDKDTTIYLFGTIHLLPKGYQWRSTKFNAALASSQQLVVETIVDQNSPELAGVLMKTGFSQGLPPIAQRVPPAKVALLRSVIAKTGYPEKV